MKIWIKPHSSYREYFSESILEVDIDSSLDILLYLKSVHPKFMKYLNDLYSSDIPESFAVLDNKLRIVDLNALEYFHPREGDTIYLVPAIIGGGGKRGFLALALMTAVVVATGGFGITAAGAASAGAAGSAAAGGAAAASTGISLTPFLQNIAVNVALAVISSLFLKKKKESTLPENSIYDSLTNTTSSGTPVALNYGLVRVAGQMISGYVKTVQHDPSHTNMSITTILENNKD